MFSQPGAQWGQGPAGAPSAARDAWSRQRADFLRFYGLRASANFSLGSHDELAILRLLNSARRKASATAQMLDGDAGDQIAAYFDGVQIDAASSETSVSRGYAV